MLVLGQAVVLVLAMRKPVCGVLAGLGFSWLWAWRAAGLPGFKTGGRRGIVPRRAAFEGGGDGFGRGWLRLVRMGAAGFGRIRRGMAGCVLVGGKPVLTVWAA